MIGLILGWTVFGLIVGAIARLLWPGRQNLGCLTTILLGVAGSLVGGAITWAIMGGGGRDFHPSSWLMSIVGAVLVLWIFGASRRRYD